MVSAHEYFEYTLLALTSALAIHVFYGLVTKDLPYIRKLRCDAEAAIKLLKNPDLESLSFNDVESSWRSLSKLLDRPFIGGRKLRREAASLERLSLSLYVEMISRKKIDEALSSIDFPKTI